MRIRVRLSLTVCRQATGALVTPRQMRVKVGDRDKEMESDDNKDKHSGNGNEDSTFEPKLAVFKVETEFYHVTQKLWLAGQGFANAGTNIGLE